MADDFDGTDAAIAEAVERLLVANGPMSDERLIGELAAAGLDVDPDGDQLIDVLDELDGVLPLADERWAWAEKLLAGRVFTHRLAATEVEHDLLDLSPDLGPVAVLTENERHQQLADGSAVVEVFASTDADLLDERGIPLDAVADDGGLLLSRGRLSQLGLRAGDLVGVRLTPGGLTLEAVEENVLPADPPAALGRRLGAVLSAADGPQPLEIAVWTACADEPELFGQPLPPLGQLLGAVGFAHDGDWIAAAGFDFARWRVENRVGAVARRYGLSDDEALAVLTTVTLFERVADLHATATAAQESGDSAALAEVYTLTAQRDQAVAAGGPDTAAGAGRGEATVVRATLEFLAEPAVAEAVLEETIGAADEQAAALGLFAETLEELAPRPARPALRWLRAKAHERLGDLAQAEAVYHAAESLDPSWPPTLLDLARYASDRGDATRGLALLRRAGAPRDHVLVEVLGHFEPKPRPDLGRNQPCWCGSGRKYKQCHLHREQLPLADRAAWLYQKAGMCLFDGPARDTLFDAAAERARYADSPYALLEAVRDPLVTDAVLFEGGAFADFLDTRGGLLPDDERLLAEQWLLTDRSIYEVQAARLGSGLSVRDLRTGDVHDVRERSASRQLKPGQLICARIVPAGDSTQIFGGVEPVALHQRDELIALLDTEPGPSELVAFLSRRYAPPALQNTEGDPLVLCQVTLHVPDLAALTRALDDTYDRDDADTRWFEHVTTHGMQRIRATLTLDHDQLTVQTNSEARQDRVLDALRTLDPSLTVLDESRQPARDAREVMKHAPRGADAAEHRLDPDDPAVASALDQFARDYEQKWLDEPIPALAGHTPRQAAADPTRRDDLIRLLDSFPARDTPGTMHPDRLRVALDLP